MKYAGFIKRTAAFFLDYFLIAIISLFLGGMTNSSINLSEIHFKGIDIPQFRLAYYSVFIVLILIYYIVLEGTEQATLGKNLLGLKVVNKEGKNISLPSKFFRFLFVLIFAVSISIPHLFFSMGVMPVNYDYVFIDRANFISYIIAFVCFISYLCLLFSQKKQTLYDKLTKTFVIEDKEKPTFIPWLIFILGVLPILILYLSNFILLYFWEKVIG